MSDPTLDSCDAEPWNQRHEPPPSRVIHMLSVREKVLRRVPILSATGVHARFVYHDAGRSIGPQECSDCGANARTIAWTEFEHKPNTRIRVPRWDAARWQFDSANPEEIVRDYVVVERAIDLCEACSRALEGLPLGVRWQRSRTQAAVLGRCLRALESVDDAEAAAALLAIQEKRR